MVIISFITLIMNLILGYVMHNKTRNKIFGDFRWPLISVGALMHYPTFSAVTWHPASTKMHSLVSYVPVVLWPTLWCYLFLYGIGIDTQIQYWLNQTGKNLSSFCMGWHAKPNGSLTKDCLLIDDIQIQYWLNAYETGSTFEQFRTGCHAKHLTIWYILGDFEQQSVTSWKFEVLSMG